MATNITNVKDVKLVYLATEIPEESIRNAQVLILDTNAGTWHLFAPQPYKAHGRLEMMPQVHCPVVDLTPVTNEDAVCRIIKATTSPQHGVINLDGLLTGLEALGAKVKRVSESASQPDAVDVNAAWRARKEGSVAKKMRAITAYENNKRTARRGHAGKAKVH